MPTPRKYNTEAERYAAYRKRKQEARLQEMRIKGLPLLPPIPSMPGKRRWTALSNYARDTLTTERDEMENYIQDRSEAWQEGETGQAQHAQLEVLQDVLERMEDLD